MFIKVSEFLKHIASLQYTWEFGGRGVICFAFPFSTFTVISVAKNRNLNFDSVQLNNTAARPVMNKMSNLLSSPTGPAEHWAGGSRAKSFNSWEKQTVDEVKDFPHCMKFEPITTTWRAKKCGIRCWKEDSTWGLLNSLGRE